VPIAEIFVRWTWCRAVLHRGWWLVTSVYLVVDARLSAPQLVLVGVAQSVVALVFEVPAGVVADALSRKWSLFVSHLLMGTAMSATAVVDGFAAIAVTQMVWGLSWTFASGADVAWVSDELDDPAGVPTVLIRADRAQLTGTVAGLVGIGGLAWLTGRGTAMVLAGATMVVLGGVVAVGFPERRLRSRPARILGTGVSVVRGSRGLMVILGATFVVNGVGGNVGRLFQLRLVGVGLSADPVLWFTGLGVVMCLAGGVALRVVQPHVHGPHTARRAYSGAVAVMAVGVVGLAFAPEEVTCSSAIMLAGGALPLARSFGTIWVNGQIASGVRATVHSLFAQADYLGGIVCGLALAVLPGLVPAVLACGLLLAVVSLIALRSGTFRGAEPPR
jgi:hypothetical protein